MAQHTKGPWRVMSPPEAQSPFIVADAEGGSIADCEPAGPWMNDEEAAANASLCAAAPDRREHCQRSRSMTIDRVAEMTKIWETPDVDCSTPAIQRALDELTAAMKAKGWPKASANLCFEDGMVTIALRVVPIGTPTAEEPAAFGQNAWTFPTGHTVSDAISEAHRKIAEKLAENPVVSTAPWWDMAQLEERAASC